MRIDLPSVVPTVASLFSGGGGWEAGAVESGFAPLWGCELDPQAAAAHRAAFPETVIFEGSVADLDTAELPSPDILCCSPPCQAYSPARRPGLTPRCDRDIGLEVLRFAADLRPGAILLENAAAYEKSPVFQAIVEGLRDLGYAVEFRVFSAATFGVSQRRRRLIMCAADTIAGTAVDVLTHVAGPEPIGWLGEIDDLLPQLPPAAPLANWQRRGMDPCFPKSWPILVVGGNPTSCRIDNKTYRKSWYGPDQVGPTMVKEARNMSGTRIVLSPSPADMENPLRFTPRCAARIQTFPDWYPLPADERVAWAIVGNAVPPLMAGILLEAVEEVL